MNKDPTAVDSAILQMQHKAYTTELIRHGCKKILLYAIHFDGKAVNTKMVLA